MHNYLVILVLMPLTLPVLQSVKLPGPHQVKELLVYSLMAHLTLLLGSIMRVILHLKTFHQSPFLNRKYDSTKWIYDINHCSISGGTVFTLTGSEFDTVQEPRMIFYYQPLVVNNGKTNDDFMELESEVGINISFSF